MNCNVQDVRNTLHTENSSLQTEIIGKKVAAAAALFILVLALVVVVSAGIGVVIETEIVQHCHTSCNTIMDIFLRIIRTLSTHTAYAYMPTVLLQVFTVYYHHHHHHTATDL